LPVQIFVQLPAILVGIFVVLLGLSNMMSRQHLQDAYRVFREQADLTFILPSELPTKELRHLPRKMPPQTSQTSQYVAPRGGIFLGKWCSTFAGSSEGKMNVCRVIKCCVEQVSEKHLTYV
jgi:hypothetical protein